jgi:uncharacterized SAM-binding protein YcdF (DUF218 family)
VWVCLVVLSLLLLWKRQRRFAVATGLLVVVIFVIGSTSVPGSILATLERPWAGTKIEDLPRCDAVVLLGGSTEPARYEVGHLHLSLAGDRPMMALDLLRLGKAPALVIGGSGAMLDDRSYIEADLLKDFIEERGLAKGTEVISLGKCDNTHDEAVKVRALSDQRMWKRVLLVTSANHMRRAVAVFHTVGVNVVPVPCNFLTTVSTAEPPPGVGVPRSDGFNKIAIWLHEQVGWIIYRRLGWIDPSKQ